MTVAVLDAVGAPTITPPLPPGDLAVRAALAHLVQGQDLSADEMAVVVGQRLDGSGSSVQVAALLTALRMKGEELRAGGEIAEWDVTPADFGLSEADPAELIGGDAKRNAALLCETLEGAPGAL